MSGKVLSATQKITKTGEPYVILVIPEARELSGVKYTAETSVFCFKNEAAMKLKQGDTVKFIAKRTVSKEGNEFITMLQLIK
jgi:Cu/Ag efflux protein CusF